MLDLAVRRLGGHSGSRSRTPSGHLQAILPEENWTCFCMSEGEPKGAGPTKAILGPEEAPQYTEFRLRVLCHGRGTRIRCLAFRW